MMVKVGNRELEMDGEQLTELRSSNDILHDKQALRERMEEDGYLLIRGFHERDKVLAARTSILEKMDQMGKLDRDTQLEDGVMADGSKTIFMGGTNEDLPALLNVLNGEHIMRFFDEFIGEQSLTYHYKWLRAVGKGDFTGAHYDIVYMGRGTKNVYTVWSPLGDVSYEMGGLAICLGSHRFEKLKQSYGSKDSDRDGIGHYTDDPLVITEKFGGKWATTEFQAGDVLIFGMFLMHCSLENTTNQYRISVDARYQSANEQVDERWSGKKPKGHFK
ncbi:MULTISPECIES: phytanoyl-CoA dioxygenase family protein [Paenibacillus]|uniref:Phytanoyl-CoA dioxygenase family protein n=1 Tax=Paenibacillus violae TaxID=3077234 RepID=A0ABU3R5U8_9BACL|nr:MULTISPECIES: phytanoyl-CoA dioxygenase family protein [Paenibacillus]MDU0199645.1 phytanoyl-CoA dioxygenase family protein [Paenibacillus sp. PFR10]MEC0267803.1 phytanoyl-CoA dioxygenase family protein [Paenibacillus anseongense]